MDMNRAEDQRRAAFAKVKRQVQFRFSKGGITNAQDNDLMQTPEAESQ